MKNSSKNRSSQLIAGLFTAVLACVTSSAAHAQFLLQIDDSHPDAVIITAVEGATPSTSVGSYPILNGIDLLGFFGGAPGLNDPTNVTGTSSLVAGSSPLAFTQWDVDNFGGSNSNLGLFNQDTPGDISFTTEQQAFSGTLTLNLTGYVLPGSTGSGTLQTGYNTTDGSGGPNTPIGQWEIVNPVATPEPATWVLLAISLALLPLLRRFRRA